MGESSKIVFRLRFHLFCEWSGQRWFPKQQQWFPQQQLWQQQECQQQVGLPYGWNSFHLQPGNSTGSASSSGCNFDDQVTDFVGGALCTYPQVLHPPPGLPHPVTGTCHASVEQGEQAATGADAETEKQSVNRANEDADALVQQILDQAARENNDLKAAHAEKEREIQADLENAQKEVAALKKKIEDESEKCRARLKEKTATYANQLRFFDNKLLQEKESTRQLGARLEQVEAELKEREKQKQELEEKLKHANEKLATKAKITEGKPRECAICYVNTTSKAFLPCEHAGTCKECTTDWLQQSNLCPVCRTEIKDVIGVKIVG